MDQEQIDQMLTGLDAYAIGKERDSKGRRVGKRVLVWRDLRELSEAMLATGVRIGEVLAFSGDDVAKDDDGKPAVWVDAHIIRVKGTGIIRVPGRKGNKPGVLLTLPDWATTMFAQRKLAAGPRSPLFASLEGGWLDPSNTGNRIRLGDLPRLAQDRGHTARPGRTQRRRDRRPARQHRAVTERNYIQTRSRNKKAAAALESIKRPQKTG
jgi:integrase